ncbi:hypothetical protein [Komagataeibacter kakiaceti]|uniref:hypothetical protein n=1 Tax=Komagataeibacter kakiaceti TaxID=943261 RepID=UPI000472430F|nr:hypothetical protein [Komagataeibacter kakiaceti]
MNHATMQDRMLMTRPIILDLTPDAQGMAALFAAVQVPDHVRPVLVLFSGGASRLKGRSGRRATSCTSTA